MPPHSGHQKDLGQPNGIATLDGSSEVPLAQLPGSAGRKDNLVATSAPNGSNDNTEGYAVGSIWVDVTNDDSYTCVDASTGTAVWEHQGQGAQGDPGLVWTGPWVTAFAYVVSDAVEHNGSAYICIVGHTSGASTEPGVGGSWETNWDLLAASSIPQVLTKSMMIERPKSGEDLTLFFTNKAITITEIRAVVRGTTPSVTWTIRHGTSRSATGAEAVTGGTVTTDQSTGSDVTAFNDATIVADSFVWLETTAESGMVLELAITLIYTED